MKKIFIIILALFAAISGSAQQNSQLQACIVDNTATNIRNAPGGTIVTSIDSDKYDGLVVSLIASQGAWWSIKPAIEICGDNEGEIELTGSSSGYWIHRSVIQFSHTGSFDHYLRKAPGLRAKKIALPRDTETSFHPIAVKGNWVKVVTTTGSATGWLQISDICANPLTTCP